MRINKVLKLLEKLKVVSHRFRNWVKVVALMVFVTVLLVWFLEASYHALFSTHYVYYCGQLTEDPIYETERGLDFVLVEIGEYPRQVFRLPGEFVVLQKGDTISVRATETIKDPKNRIPPAIVYGSETTLVTTCE